MRSQCPGCGTLYTITQEHLGRQIQCKKCGYSFVIEAVSSEAPPPAALPQSDPQPSSGTGQAPQMIQVTCQHCSSVNQMPPGVICNCGHCGQPLPVSAPSGQPWSGQASPQAMAPPQLNAQARSVAMSNFDVGQILGSVFSILFKKPAIFFGLGILAGLPSALFLGKHAKTIETAEEMAEFAGEDELIITDYLYPGFSELITRLAG